MSQDKAERPYSRPISVAQPLQLNPTLFEAAFDELIGDKAVSEVKEDVQAGKWPFRISPEQMREDLENWGK